MAESLPHRGATLWGSLHCHCSREAQPTERFYKSVRPYPYSRVHRYKTLYLWWLRSTIHRKNRPCRSYEDLQEVEWDRSLYVVPTGDLSSCAPYDESFQALDCTAAAENKENNAAPETQKHTCLSWHRQKTTKPNRSKNQGCWVGVTWSPGFCPESECFTRFPRVLKSHEKSWI